MKVEIIGVVGAGQMGRGIAQVAVRSGYSVKLWDSQREALSGAYDFIEKKLAQNGDGDGHGDIRRLEKARDWEALRDVDLVIEAVPENKDIKFHIFRELDALTSPEAILASNTSSLSITEIAAQTERPEKVVGMHFMNPVPVMALVEGIRGLETSDETFQTVAAVAERMGKVLIQANDGAGFAVNRILMPMINEAIYTLQEGVVAEVKDIDTAMKLGTRQPMGPLELADFIGLDTCLAIMNALHEGLGDSKYRPCPLLKKYVAAGRLGRKAKRGFYEY